MIGLYALFVTDLAKESHDDTIPHFSIRQPIDEVHRLRVNESKASTSNRTNFSACVYQQMDLSPFPRSMRSTQILQALAKSQNAKPTADKPVDKVALKQYPKDKLPGSAALIDGNFKLHRKVAKSGQASYSLIDLAQDSRKTTDVSAKHPERLHELKAQLEAWQKSVVGSLNGEDYK